MKKKYLAAEFAAVFFLLVLPPLLVRSGEGSATLVSAADFSWTALMQLAVALFLDIQFRCTQRQVLPSAPAAAQSFQKLVTVLLWGSTTFGCLMLIYALMGTLALLLPSFFAAGRDFPVPAPGLLLALNLAAGAYYEEVLYRQFIPGSLRSLLPARRLAIPVELVSLLLFAFSHRYLGAPSVLNAALCGIMLRICCIRTGGVRTGAAVHFLYNMLLVLASALLGGGD